MKKEGGGHQWIKKRKIYTNDAVSKKLSDIRENGETVEMRENGETAGLAKNGEYKNKPLKKTSKKTKATPKEYLSVRENLKLTQIKSTA